MNIRIKSISISNLNNVNNGSVELFSDKTFVNNPLECNILGVYGQNGSGKTTLVQAIRIVKYLLMGKSLPSSFFDIIQIDKIAAKIEVVFSLEDQNKYYVRYSCQIKKTENSSQNISTEYNNETENVLTVAEENLSYSVYQNDKFSYLTTLIKTRPDSSVFFEPQTKFNEFSGNSNSAKNDLFIAYKVSNETSKSFIFQKNTLKIFKDNCNNKEYLKIIDSLVYYSNFHLFVVDTRNDALINMNILMPINFNIRQENGITIGSIILKTDDSENRIPEKVFASISKSIDSMNIVLCQLIPGMSIILEDTGREYDKNGDVLIRTNLVSYRNGKKISLSNESAGIKKLISVLQLLITMYNNYMTVVIDELDSGIFEYLLGELLRIISKQGKGQLIFTSHNLRALETINKQFVCFTTTNPENRYYRMKNVKKNNNLRDFYYHEILLGGQSEELYEQTRNGAIALAFREAGGIDE